MKYIFLALSVIFSFPVLAQSFTDDFESYEEGEGVAEQSNEWSVVSGMGPRGGNTDIEVVDRDARSGNQSLRFRSLGNNRFPPGVYLSIGGLKDLGELSTDFWIKVDDGDAAYFNVQGSQQNGQTVVMRCIAEGEILTVYDYDWNAVGEAEYTPEEWTQIGFEVDLTNNNWQVFVSEEKIAEFENGFNKVASIGFIAADAASDDGIDFYLDDISYRFKEYEYQDFNAQMARVTYTGGEFAGDEAYITAEVRNLGSFEINQMKLGYVFEDVLITQEIQGLSMVTGNYQSVTFDVPITITQGLNYVEAYVLEVEGKSDDVSEDDSKVLIIKPYEPAKNKVILLEAGTSTVCGTCPIVDVTMQKAVEEMGDWIIPIEVHERDPMQSESGADFFSSVIGAYPAVSVNRQDLLETYPESSRNQLLKYLEAPPAAFIEVGATFDEVNNNLRVQGVYVLQEGIETGSWKVSCALVEAEVTSTDASYDQRNDYWIYRGNGDFGGYESKERIVPAAEMVYRNVLREYSASFEGSADIPLISRAGDTVLIDFFFELDSSWKTENLRLIPLLLNEDGVVDNAASETYAQAIENGLLEKTLSIESVNGQLNALRVFPNPTSGRLTISGLNNLNTAHYQIHDIRGILVQSGLLNERLDIGNVEPGMYFLSVQAMDQVYQKRFSVVR